MFPIIIVQEISCKKGKHHSHLEPSNEWKIKLLLFLRLCRIEVQQIYKLENKLDVKTHVEN